jgi:hypothetical protein
MAAEDVAATEADMAVAGMPAILVATAVGMAAITGAATVAVQWADIMAAAGMAEGMGGACIPPDMAAGTGEERILTGTAAGMAVIPITLMVMAAVIKLFQGTGKIDGILIRKGM